MKENEEVRIIVAGGRDFDNYGLLSSILTEYIGSKEVIIISGTAKGADGLGERFAADNGIEVRRFPAKCDEYGKSDGIIRNREMANYAAQEKGVLFAFLDGKSKGTKNMIDLAKRYGLEIHVVNYD